MFTDVSRTPVRIKNFACDIFREAHRGEELTVTIIGSDGGEKPVTDTAVLVDMRNSNKHSHFNITP